MDNERIDYALKNLAGCWSKLDDARFYRFGQTWERAGRDSVEVLEHYVRVLCRELDRPLPVDLQGVRI